MNQISQVNVDGEIYTYLRLMKEVPRLTTAGAKNRIYRYKKGKIGKEKLFARVTGVYEIDGQFYTLTELIRLTGYDERHVYNLLAQYRKGKIPSSRLLSRLNRRKVEEPEDGMEPPEYDPEDRSPGWLERKYLRPTTFSKGGRCQECNFKGIRA